MRDIQSKSILNQSDCALIFECFFLRAYQKLTKSRGDVDWHSSLKKELKLYEKKKQDSGEDKNNVEFKLHRVALSGYTSLVEPILKGYPDSVAPSCFSWKIRASTYSVTRKRRQSWRCYQ